MAYIDVKSRNGDKFVLKFDLCAYQREDGDYIASVREGGDIGEYETCVYPTANNGEIEIDCTGRRNLVPRGIFRYYTWNGKVIVESSPVPFPNPSQTLPPRPSAPKPSAFVTGVPEKPAASLPTPSTPSPSSSKKKGFGKFSSKKIGGKSLGSFGKKLSTGVTVGVGLVGGVVSEGMHQLEASAQPRSQEATEEPKCRESDKENSAAITRGSLEIPELKHVFTLNLNNPPPRPEMAWDERYLEDVIEYFSDEVRDALRYQFQVDCMENDRNFKRLQKLKKNPMGQDYQQRLDLVQKQIVKEQKRLNKIEKIQPCRPYGFGNDYDSHYSKNPCPNQNTKALEVGMIVEFMPPPMVKTTSGGLSGKPMIYLYEILDIQGDDLTIAPIRATGEYFKYYDLYVVKYNHGFIGPIGSAQFQKDNSYYPFFIPELDRDMFSSYYGTDYVNILRYLNRRPVPRNFFGRKGFIIKNPTRHAELNDERTIRKYVEFSIKDVWVAGTLFSRDCGLTEKEWDKRATMWKGLPTRLLLSHVPDGDVEKIACGRNYKIDKTSNQEPMVYFEQYPRMAHETS